MKKLLAVPLFLLIACAGQSAQQDGFDASICNQVPIGVEQLAAYDPENSEFKISCADLASCTSIMGWDAPPDIPCQN